MNRYLVESTHSAEECHHVVEQFYYHGFIINFDWGCEEGVHTGWAIVKSENTSEALLAVPAHLRSKARAIRLAKYSPEKMQSMHG